MPRKSLILSPLILLLTVLSAPTRAQERLSADLVKDDKVRTSYDVRNGCTAPHVYQPEERPEMSWFRFVGERTATISPGEQKNFEVEFDSTALEVGTYSGGVFLTCLDCASEPGCFIPRPIKPVRLKVIWSSAELEGMTGEYVAGQILVSLETESSSEVSRLVREIEKKYQLKRLKIIRLRSISQTAVLFSILNPIDSVPLLVARLVRDPAIHAAQPNFIYTASGAQKRDYENPQLQYGLWRINAHLAQHYSTGRGVRVALLDSGVDDRHRDLQGKIVELKNFTDDAGYRQDIHGTIMAGIIAAIPRNGFGISGIAPDAEIISVKVLKQRPNSEKYDGTVFDILQGVEFAIVKRANVINMSFGKPNNDPRLAAQVRGAVKRGIVVVAAAGNDGPRAKPTYPAALKEVIAVSAVDVNNLSYDSGSRGDYIDVAAPGVDILSTWPGDGLNRSPGGTSEAAAHVTGVVALLLGKMPATSPR